ncbi:hypothetical protein OUZ56_031966 [Daphnia magna]|uniref:Uncharacterized protein n=1 Tax=Daphnia magna TaxID=35525 RepID=A0ABQ9ZVR7_9CRUS|nr:hypothetical protein OUZ56_031966 [Daphnia magna]
MVQADGLQHGQSVPITRSQSSLIFFQLRNGKDGVYISGEGLLEATAVTFAATRLGGFFFSYLFGWQTASKNTTRRATFEMLINDGEASPTSEELHGRKR